MQANEDKLVVNLLRIGNFLLKEGNRITEKYGLNQQQFVVLNLINLRGPIAPKEICSRLLFEKSNVSKISKKLETLGFVNKIASETDSRSFHLEITESGKTIIAKGIADFNEFNAKLLEPLSEKQLKEALVSTNLINDCLNN